MPVDPTSIENDSRFSTFMEHFAALVETYKNEAENHNILLEMPIPFSLPHGRFLEYFFSDIPFTIVEDDFSPIIDTDNQKKLVLKDERKPRTLISIFRFQEYYRQEINMLESNIKLIKSKYNVIHEKDQLRNILNQVLVKQQWSQADFDNKGTRFQQIVKQRDDIEKIENKLSLILNNSQQVMLEWKALLQNFYSKSINYINQNWQESLGDEKATRKKTFNLRQNFHSNRLREELAPFYSQAMMLTIQLMRSIQMTALVL